MKRKIIFSSFFAFLLLLTSCKDDALPKPPSQLRLDYPLASYATYSNGCPFTFDVNEDVTVKEDKNCGFSIQYPKMKATIYLTYKPVNNDITKLLRDAQKLTFEHVVKADDITELPFLNRDKKVYGMFYKVNGNAATNAQFYVTDSINHFVTGSVYFYAKPNFDSIMPATSYVKDDMQHLMESLQWK